MDDRKKLGFGLMRLPLTDAEDQSKIDYKRLCDMADRFIGSGFTYFDTAAPYHNRASETAFRDCIVKRYNRDAFTITDKLSLFRIQKAEEIPGFFQAQLENCGVDYFDYYLIHALSKDAFKQAEDMNAFEFISQKKAEGKIKHIGFSFHDNAQVLEEILTKHPEMEYVQLQLNYADWEDPDVQSRKCYEVCVKHNKPVIVMEPVKGGLLSSVPEEAERLLKSAAPDMSTASWGIRFAASLENVVMVLSGMSTEEQLDDNLAYMSDFKPLTDTETELVKKVAEIIKSKEAIACTGCRYCVEGCPKKIAIPNYFKLMNNVSKFGERQKRSARANYARYVDGGSGKASDCVKCGQCERRCPQHLPIIKFLEDTAAALE